MASGKTVSNKTPYAYAYGSLYADKISNSSKGISAEISASTGKDKNTNYASKVTIDGGDGKDTIFNYASNVSIDGGAGNNKIESNGSFVTIAGGNGNDSVSLTGRTKRLIYYAAYNTLSDAWKHGNDVIYGFGSTDTVSIAGGSYTRSTVGNDVVLKIGSGSVTLKGAKGKTINILVTQASSSGLTKTSGSTTASAKGANYTNKNSNRAITATGKADTLCNYGSNVQADYSTVDGGADNDTIKSYGSYGRIDGGDGNDFIYGFGNNDLLQITGAFSVTYRKAKQEVYVNVGSTNKAITLKNFVTSTFRVNNKTYKL